MHCVVPENIHMTPRKGFAVWPPVPLWIFQNRPPKFTPPHPSPLEFPKFAHTPLEAVLSLIEVHKEVVLFTRMPNFVRFVYFLLNCITDKQISYANSLCAQVTDKFCEFHVLQQMRIPFALKSWRNCWKSSWPHANEMQGRVGNITVLFSHCVEKKVHPKIPKISPSKYKPPKLATQKTRPAQSILKHKFPSVHKPLRI